MELESADVLTRIVSTVAASGITSILRAGYQRLRKLDKPGESPEGIVEIVNNAGFLSFSGSLPANVTIEGVRRAVQTPAVQELVLEMTLLKVSGEAAELHGRLRSDLATLIERELGSGSEELASGIADFCAQKIHAGVTELRKPKWRKGKDHVSFLEAAARDRLMVLTLQAIKDNSEWRQRFQTPEDYRRLKEWVGKYRAGVVRDHGRLELPDLEKRHTVHIDELYVPPEFSNAKPRERTQAYVMISDFLEERESVDITRFSHTIRRTVLLGDPGAGKTTAARYLSYKHASGQFDRLPFTVTLREFATEGNINKSIVEFIEEKCRTIYQAPPPQGAVDYLLSNGEAVVFFDGLDELLNTTDRREVTRRVELFLEMYPAANALVTSRRIGYDQARLDPDLYDEFHLEKFSKDLIKEYVEKWFRVAVGVRDDAELQKTVSAFMDESRGLPDLVSNPLMLSLVCVLYRGQGSIPQNRAAVYERCSQLLFHEWEANKKIHADIRIRNQVDAAINHLAYWQMVDNGGKEAVTETVLIRETTEFLRDSFSDERERQAAAKEFIDFCAGRLWVFTAVGTTGGGERLFEFTHRTFREYFAAYELTRLNDTPEEVAEALFPHIVEERWDVIGQLAVQLKEKHTRNGADRVIKTLIALVDDKDLKSQSRVYWFCWRCLGFLMVTPTTRQRLVERSLECSLRLLVVRGPSLSEIIDLPIEGAATCMPETLDDVVKVLTSLLLTHIEQGGPAGIARILLISWPIGDYSPSTHDACWRLLKNEIQSSLDLVLPESRNHVNLWRLALIYRHVTLDEFWSYCDSTGLDPFGQLFEDSWLLGSSLVSPSLALVNAEWNNSGAIENLGVKLEQMETLPKLGFLQGSEYLSIFKSLLIPPGTHFSPQAALGMFALVGPHVESDLLDPHSRLNRIEVGDMSKRIQACSWLGVDTVIAQLPPAHKQWAERWMNGQESWFTTTPTEDDAEQF